MKPARWTAGTRRLAVAIGAALALGSIPASTSAQTVEGAGFVGYEASASGTAVSAFPTLPALLPVEVPFEATLSLATATISSGGQGFGRASTFWPGTLTAGLRPLIEQGAGVRLPLPDYPVVVEGREFEEAKRSEVPGLTMAVDVDPDRAVAVADTGALALEALVGVRSMRTESRTVLEAGQITATSRTTLEGVQLAEALSIGSIVSEAVVTSDGTTATCRGGVTITGGSVAGTPVTIDDTGIHVEGSPSAPGLGLGPAVESVLSGLGLEARVLGGADACTGAFGNRTTSGLLVRLPLPALGPVPAGGGISVVLGSTTASAGASVLPADDVPLSDDAPVLGDVVTRLPGPLGGGAALPPATPTPSGRSGSLPSAPDPVSYTFGGVPLSLVAGLALLALAGSSWLRRYVRRITALVGSP